MTQTRIWQSTSRYQGHACASICFGCYTFRSLHISHFITFSTCIAPYQERKSACVLLRERLKVSRKFTVSSWKRSWKNRILPLPHLHPYLPDLHLHQHPKRDFLMTDTSRFDFTFFTFGPWATGYVAQSFEWIFFNFFTLGNGWSYSLG